MSVCRTRPSLQTLAPNCPLFYLVRIVESGRPSSEPPLVDVPQPALRWQVKQSDEVFDVVSLVGPVRACNPIEVR